MNDLIVCMTYTDPQGGMMPQYLQQLKNAGIDYFTEQSEEPVKQMVLLGSRIPRAIRFSQQFKHYKRIVISDAYDVIFMGTKDEVISKIPEDFVLLSTERNCFPDPSITEHIGGPTAWKFANGGLLAGAPNTIMEWAYAIQTHKLYRKNRDDQAFFNECLFMYQTIPVTLLDYPTNLFYSLYNERTELQFTKGKPENTITGAHPNFIHANGHWACGEIWHRYEVSLGTAKPIETFPVKIPFTSQITIEMCRQCRDRLVAMNLGTQC